MRESWVSVRWLTALGLALGVWVGDGAPAVARAPKARTLVVLAAKNRPQVAKRALVALRSQLSDTKVVLRVVWVQRLARSRASQVALSKRHATKAGVLAVAWYDAGRPEEILMVAARSKRLVTRRVTGTSLAARLEALAIIVRQSMLALLAGQPLPPQPPPRRTVPRVPPRAKRPPPRPVVRRRRAPPRPVRPRRPPPRRITPPVKPPAPRTASWRFGFLVEGGYALSGYGADGGAVHGGELGVAFHLRAGWEVLLSYRITQKVTGRSGTARLDLQPHPIGLGARWRRQWGRFVLGLGLTLVADYATFSTDVDPATHTARRDPGDLLWSVMPEVTVGLALSSRLRLFLAARAQIGLNWRRYVLEEQSTAVPLLSPWPVQPLMMIGFSVDVIK